MKNFTAQQAFAALFLTATVAIAPAANASETKSVDNIQSTRLEFLNNHSKSVDNIQKLCLNHLDTRSKNVESIQKTRLTFLNDKSKNAKYIQK